MKLLKIFTILLTFSLVWGCYMKSSRLSDVEIIRNYLIKDEVNEASEIPIDECTPEHLPYWLKDLRFYRVHIGAFFPKDPIPSPIYKIIDSEGNIIDNILTYLNKKGFIPKSKKEAIDVAVTIVQIEDMDSNRVIVGQNKLSPDLLGNVDASFIKDYQEHVPEDIRNKIIGPSVQVNDKGYEVLLYVYFRDMDTMGDIGKEYILKLCLLIYKSEIKFDDSKEELISY